MAAPSFQQNQQDLSYVYQFAYPGYSLYVGNMDRRLTEQLFLLILHHFFPNQVLACKFFEEVFYIRVGCGEPYCFIMFTDPSVASAALNIFNGREVYGKVSKLRVNWACPPTAPRQITFTESDGFAIYVGDLGADIDDNSLLDAFQTFGEVR
ncbi:hypothetical protein HZS_5281 [Henneguya salminicola]|nr:hypothetical protein HZS_5281 [Henneguya salminicola]